jgi:hypothetical protein
VLTSDLLHLLKVLDTDLLPSHTHYQTSRTPPL